MTDGIKKILIGKPLKNEELGSQKYGVFWGLPILSSDAISSVAYAGEEILFVLIPAIGLLAYDNLLKISAAIIGLLLILVFSYRQTIQNYPNGGGAYIVAKDNLGVLPGVTAGAALSVDYILTVAVSVSSGVEQVTSAFSVLKPYTLELCIVVVFLLMIGNLRGIRESSIMFGVPAYAFILGMIILIGCGLFKIGTGYQPTMPVLPATESITLFLLLRAFSNGCAALTGVEAVSNAIPNFREPSIKNARRVLLLLATIILAVFGGISVLINLYHPVSGHGAVLIQLSSQIFGRGPLFYYIMATAFIILVMASNTAYSDFPLLLSVISRDGYAPRQLSMRGERLSYSNGIISLSVAATLLIIIFSANVTRLIGLYAVGVFISFTLSQFGMFIKWTRSRKGAWIHKALINGFGATVTFIVAIIIAITKFEEGAWIVVLLVPLLVVIMLKIKKHYMSIAKQLKLEPEELSNINLFESTYKNRVIVPIESVNKASVRALRYARTISDNIVAFNVSINEENGRKIKEKYSLLKTDIPLKVYYSQYRKVISPLLKFIESAEYDYQKGDMITIILPQFQIRSWWKKFLHNQTRVFIERELLKHKHIVVATMPLQLKRDDKVK